MLSTNLTQEEIDHYFKQAIVCFKPLPGFELEDYYGVAIMSVKKNDTIQLRLQYEYDRKPINGAPLEFSNLEDALNTYIVMMLKRKPRIAVSKETPTFSAPSKSKNNTLFDN